MQIFLERLSRTGEQMQIFLERLSQMAERMQFFFNGTVKRVNKCNMQHL